MSTISCINKSLSDTYRQYRDGGTVTVVFDDKSEYKIDYATSDDFIASRSGPGDPGHDACASFEVMFDKHKNECAACREEWSTAALLTRLSS